MLTLLILTHNVSLAFFPQTGNYQDSRLLTIHKYHRIPMAQLLYYWLQLELTVSILTQIETKQSFWAQQIL